MQTKKYDRGVIEEIKARKAEEDRIKSKWEYSIVCNHIADPASFLLSKNAKIERLHINKTPPKGMTGYIYICSECIPYMENINQETSKRCFQRMHESEFMKNINEHQSLSKRGIIIR